MSVAGRKGYERPEAAAAATMVAVCASLERAESVLRHADEAIRRPGSAIEEATNGLACVRAELAMVRRALENR